MPLGGAYGALLVAILTAHPRLRGILYDLPHVIAGARPRLTAAAVTDHCDAIAGDFFAAVPDGGDSYLLKHILHDWDDGSCLRLLRKCAGELAAGGRLICIDVVLPPLGDPTSMQLKLMDLHMMVGLPGKERTEDEWRRLFHSTGFALERIVHPDPRHGASLIEGVRTRD